MQKLGIGLLLLGMGIGLSACCCTAKRWTKEDPMQATPNSTPVVLESVEIGVNMNGATPTASPTPGK